MATERRYFVGMTGASGAAYGLRLVGALVDAGAEVSLSVSPSAVKVLRIECDVEFDPADPDLEGIFGERARGVRYFPIDRVEAPVSSGSYRMDGAAICPCSMGTAGSIASGTSGNLIERAADVMLKERRPLVLVPREAPLSLIHLRNLVKLTEAGGIVLPAAPGFYHRPLTIEDMVDHVVVKIADCLGLRLDLVKRWGGGG